MDGKKSNRPDSDSESQGSESIGDPQSTTDSSPEEPSFSFNLNPIDRRRFIVQSGLTVAAASIANNITFPEATEASEIPAAVATEVQANHPQPVTCKFTVNGKTQSIEVDPRTTLLDTLRDHLYLSGTKKGCDHGQCGACTVHLNGERILSCLTLAATLNNDSVTTIEGLGTENDLHPMQKAFIEHDAFQCGFCTPGQIMSGVGLLNEKPSASDDEVREYMSGNICRCGAYTNILDAVCSVRDEKLIKGA